MLGKINKVVRLVIYWDFAINSGWGLLSPVFAIFILENIAIGDIAKSARIVGFAALFYWGTKVVFQLSIANYLDKNHGEIDDFWFYFIGTIITAIIPIGFIFSFLPWHIYVLQVMHAVGMSMVTPSYNAIFIRHIDKGREAYETGLNNTLVSIGVGITGAIGGIIVSYSGFNIILLTTSFFTLIAALSVFLIKREVLHKVERGLHNLPPTKNLHYDK